MSNKLTVSISSKVDKLIQWIRSQITIRRAWYAWFIVFVLYIVYSIFYHELYWVQLGATLLSMFLVYLVMVTSNIELRETTERQVKAFVDNLQTVCIELKNVSNGISNLTNVMKEVQRTMLESKLVSERAIAKAEEEKRKKKESIKPQLSIEKIEPRGFGGIFGFLDMRHYFLTIWNSGSDAMGTIVQIDNRVFPEAYNIGTFKRIEINIGHINDFKGISTLNVFIETRDVDKNLYRGNVQVSLPQPQRISVPLIET